jgi:hypothetical protein
MILFYQHFKNDKYLIDFKPKKLNRSAEIAKVHFFFRIKLIIKIKIMVDIPSLPIPFSYCFFNVDIYLKIIKYIFYGQTN